MSDQSPNRLHRQLARDILLHLRTSAVQAGTHITEVSVQPLLNTSRGPIRAALGLLAAEGYLERRPNRGFYLVTLDDAASPDVVAAADDDERLYLQIADDRLAGTLAERISENDLMRRYGRPRNEIQRILTKIAAEGWIQRRSGYGWTFLPMVDSLESYREGYEMRRILEPAGLRSPSFSADAVTLRRLRECQTRIHVEGHLTLGQVELFTANSDFHEAIAGMSGNRFLVQAVVRQNGLRRLVEYRQTLDRDRVRRQTGEHLDIIDALLGGQIEEAARLMERHIGGAAREKATPAMFGRAPVSGGRSAPAPRRAPEGVSPPA